MPEASAGSTLTLDAGPIEGHGIRIGRAQLVLPLGPSADEDEPASASSARIELERVSLPPPLPALSSVSVRCGRWSMGAASLRCADGEVLARAPGVTPRPAAFELAIDGADVRARLTGLDLGAARLSAAVDGKAEAPRLTLTLEGDVAAMLARVAASAGVEVSARGAASGRIRAVVEGRPGRRRLHAELAAAAVDLSDPTGLRAAEGLSVSATLDGADAGAGWRLDAAVSVGAGGLYVHPVFVDAGTHPLEATLSARWQPGGALVVDAARVAQAGVVELRAAGSLLPRIDLAVDVPPTGATALYRVLAEPLLAGSSLAGLDVQGGRLGGSARLDDDGVAQATLTIEGLTVEDAAARFGVLGLDGAVSWGRATAPPSWLAWRGGALYRLDVGPARAAFHARGNALGLDEAAVIPILDGAVELSGLEVEGIGTPSVTARLDAALRPIGLERLAAALGWPGFPGTVAARAPVVRYADGVFRVDGVVRAELFDGTVEVRGLRIEEPFGLVPRLRADIDVHGLSLEPLTRALSFGHISGRLGGRIAGLELEDWRPIAFDAELATPEDDDTAHRISQRAVDNLASLGGTGAVVSSTFLRFFEEFSYDRLGIRCRLRRGVCEMGGVAPHDGGYYIVRGGGWPPRIDVVGYSDRVDWKTLVERLARVRNVDDVIVR
ncbi:MAG: hypothetical protein H6982_02015 [Chromatiales bacterium]|nr:hypothetical protein [Chromatiales bacterium]